MVTESLDLDLSCNNFSMWMWDQDDQFGNEICFYGTGEVDLQNYCRLGALQCNASWADSVKSYWAGAWAGSLRLTETAIVTAFRPYQSWSSTGPGDAGVPGMALSARYLEQH